MQGKTRKSAAQKAQALSNLLKMNKNKENTRDLAAEAEEFRRRDAQVCIDKCCWKCKVLTLE